ncbi:MAG: site-2 protease family protein [Polyangiales bacterium]
MNPDKLLQNAAYVIPLILSLTVHEWAHAWSAFRLGDDTAARQGRLTLNPLSHIDLVGSVLLPLMGVPFGWARPVPVNPARFGRKVSARTGMMITASAGPVSNIVLAVLCVVATGLMLRFSLRNEAVEQLLLIGFRLNVALALFNLLPIPPLDGSRVADGLMPLRLQPAWERFTRYGPLLLIAILLFPSPLQMVLGWPVLQAYRLRLDLLQAIVGS